MNNLIVVSSFVPIHNRSPVNVNKKMLTLCNDTFDCTTFITANYPYEELEGLKRIRLVNIPISFGNKGYLSDVLAYIKLQWGMIGAIRRAAREGAWVMFWLAGPMILPFIYCKLKRYKTIGFLYGNSRLKSDKVSVVNGVIAFLTGFIAKHADITCVEAAGVASHWGISAASKKVRVLHLFVDTNTFYPQVPYVDREKIIGMCCRLVDSKKVLESIEAFHRLREKYPDWCLEIAGTGFLHGACVKSIEALRETGRITMLGWIDNSSMSAVYSRWQLLLYPTNYEGLPNTMLESMACGTPALASLIGGITDIVEPQRNGWILGGRSAQDIAAALEQVISYGERKTISARARHSIKAEYDYRNTLNRFKAFFDSL